MAFPLALIPALFQAGVGIKQMIDGKNDLENLNRPEYKTPKELLTAVGLSKSEFANPRFAGQNQAEATVQQNLSQALESARQRGSGMQAVGSIVAAGNQAAQDIGAEAARQQTSDLRNYQQMLQILGQSRDTEFQMNKFAPYSDKYNEGREQIGAGQQNTFQALDSLATITGRMMSAQQGTPPAEAAQQAAASNSFTKQNEFSDVLLTKQMAQWANQASYYKNAYFKAM